MADTDFRPGGFKALPDDRDGAAVDHVFQLRSVDNLGLRGALNLPRDTGPQRD
jgi:hypothetical protein